MEYKIQCYKAARKNVGNYLSDLRFGYYVSQNIQKGISLYNKNDQEKE